MNEKREKGLRRERGLISKKREEKEEREEKRREREREKKGSVWCV